jgi:hypothetical protein
LWWFLLTNTLIMNRVQPSKYLILLYITVLMILQGPLEPIHPLTIRNKNCKMIYSG